MNIGDIFNIKQYNEAYSFTISNKNTTIKEIDPKKELVKKTRQIEKTDEDGNIFYETEEYEVEEFVNYYQIVEIPKQTIEQLSEQKRNERDNIINSIIWKVQRYDQQKQLNIKTTNTEEEYLNILKYIQYLRNIPQQENFPDIEILNFENWLLTQ